MSLNSERRLVVRSSSDCFEAHIDCKAAKLVRIAEQKNQMMSAQPTSSLNSNSFNLAQQMQQFNSSMGQDYQAQLGQDYQTQLNHQYQQAASMFSQNGQLKREFWEDV
jgi:hypothetical protein